MSIFAIHHYAFATDDVKTTYSLVEANSKQEALDKYNKVAEQRLEYPYFWNRAQLSDVFKPEIIK
jgi:hypothetical protein